ncbi:Epidermal growth factor-like domain [Phytophthora cinnamomi]|uniref:Epidermal growth factor-like domain n=1 Tax=Phytophthora cinnamomi TaxID=4785 RepID=UPI00355AB1CC|nr:Epidermal growth factor-like domain [Phytophthora cinnamomi]
MTTPNSGRRGPVRAAALFGLVFLALAALQQTGGGLVRAVELKGTHCPGEGSQCSHHGTCAINRQGEHVCNCQWGYNLPDCSRKMCPHGINPTSSQQNDKKIRLRIAATGGAEITGGALTMTFQAHTVEFDMPLPQVTSDVCTSFFRRFQNLGDLTCERAALETTSTASYDITLRTFPTFPIMNNLFYHDGNPPVSEFWCDTANVQLSSPSGSVQCVFESLSDANVKSYEECSGHGDCNTATGICACHEGFYGDHCGNNKDDEDVLVAPALGPFFKGNVLRLSATRGLSSEFYVMRADAVFSSVQLRATENLVIPSTNSYVQITSDGVASPNTARIDREHAYAGQLLVIQNDDEQPLGGDLNVAAGAAAIFVFDGGVWRPLTAAAFDTSSLTGVKTFEAANDLNLGEVTLSVQSVQVAGQRAGFVAVYGKGGVLEQHDSLRFESASGTFTAERIEAQRMRGSIDMSESELRGVDIIGGHISSVNMTAIEMVEVQGELFVEDEAFFGASVTVDGQVMGSGAYVDASDARFKTDIHQIRNASEIVSQLRGVEYAYNVEVFPSKFPHDGRRELGFIAQEVEKVAPQVVSTAPDGFKYVAYARLVPVVVEALKREQQARDDIETRLLQLESEMIELKRMLKSQQEKLLREPEHSRASYTSEADKLLEQQ